VPARFLFLVGFLLSGGCSPSSPSPDQAPAVPAADTTAAPAEEERPDWKRPFDAFQADGAFVLYDRTRNRYLRYNPERAARRFLPASTFKIFNSLVALETGVIRDTSEVMPWDGVERRVPAWNRDHTLGSAFRASAVWFYQEVARRVGEARMREHVAREHYGNEDLTGGIDAFWLTGGLRISPNEQVDLLRRLHAGTLGFSPRTMALVREIMVMERTDAHTLRGKTGWGIVDDVNHGWLVGYLERGPDVYFFATNVESAAPHFPMFEARRAITFAILEELGLRPASVP
jgi:beta-lactamase class D